MHKYIKGRDRNKEGQGRTAALVADAGGVLEDDGVAVEQRRLGVQRQQRQRVAGAQSELADVQLQRHRLHQLPHRALARRRDLHKRVPKNAKKKTKQTKNINASR